MNAPLSPDPSYLIVSSLFGALAHELRGSLSVISNDLNYLKTTTSSDDCDRGIQRCREISTLLGELSLPVQPAVQPSCSLLPVLVEAGFIVSDNLYSTAPAITADPDLLRRGMELLVKILSDRVEDPAAGIALRYEQPNTFAVRIKLAEGSIDSSRHPPSETFSTATELFNLQLAQDHIYPPLIDCIFRFHSIEMSAVLHSNTLDMRIVFPVENA